MTLWMERHNEVGVASCALKNTDGTYQETGGYFPTLFRVFCWMTFVDDIPYIDRLIKPFHPMHSQSFLSKNVEHFKTTKEVDWLTGAFLLTRRKILKKLGAFDKDFFMYTEDVELCFRIKKVGWKILYLPEWEITHIGGASSVKEFPILKEYEGIKLFYKKHNSNVEYQLLRLFLKIGAILRMLVFFIVKGAVPKTYAKAFRLA
jgi:N-acetylglucosaminyl-diphospho-decaprenol L-rhamnosyltransferase